MQNNQHLNVNSQGIVEYCEMGQSVRPGACFTINSLWIGKALPLIEQICVLSMLRQGHHVRIFTYYPVSNVPACVELADANDIVPAADILNYAGPGFKHRQLAADVFRYRLMRHEAGIWLDLDMLLLTPLIQSNQPVFGLEAPDRLNNAVFYLPKLHPLLDCLLGFTNTPYPMPPFFTPRMRLGLRRRKWLGHPVHVTDMPWGTFGPNALTHFAKTQNIMGLAASIPTFYPVGFTEARGPFISGWDTASRITPETIAIHLWSHIVRDQSSTLRQSHHNMIERGSFLAQYAARELNVRVTQD